MTFRNYIGSERLKKKDQEIAKLKAENSKLELTLERERERDNFQQKETNALKEILKQEFNESIVLGKKLVKAERLLNKKTKINRQLTKQLEKARIRISSVKQDKELLAKKVRDKQQIISDQNNEINQKQQTIAKKNAYINKQAAQITNLKKSEAELKETNTILAQILVAVNADLNSEKNRADNLQTWKDNHTCPISVHAELENLLTVIQGKETVIRELEVKLKEQTPQEVIKEITVENREIIQKLSQEQQSLKQLRYYSWSISGISVVLLVGWVRLLGKRRIK